ncbi:TetR/AcrR family transcriptional regulator [Demequina activiva]|uniref:TetR family transcriptional regulator n=1 Tax=Demequina activiva TaxID=1582364 RepID=A0A919Q751_9MICO|nr:TetR/AcrR family transcriptional regulator C-terminal domain-containing protein [Demequina activiva]GIG55025.1 TetR family transcriptional regulator [Demequina activiva]
MVRAGLTRDAVLDAAVALADAEGLAALSMRRLAADLGVEAMSLYNHVAHKRDLHEGMVDRVWGEVDLAADEPEWRARLHRICRSAHESMVTHPWFFSFPVTYGGINRIAMIEAMLGTMREAGIPADAAYHAQHVIDGHVFGYSWQDTDYANGPGLQERADAMLSAIDAERFPYLMEHARQHIGTPPVGDGFVIGLDTLFDALEARR